MEQRTASSRSPPLRATPDDTQAFTEARNGFTSSRCTVALARALRVLVTTLAAALFTVTVSTNSPATTLTIALRTATACPATATANATTDPLAITLRSGGRNMRGSSPGAKNAHKVLVRKVPRGLHSPLALFLLEP
jgi:hypothetical protein